VVALPAQVAIAFGQPDQPSSQQGQRLIAGGGQPAGLRMAVGARVGQVAPQMGWDRGGWRAQAGLCRTQRFRRETRPRCEVMLLLVPAATPSATQPVELPPQLALRRDDVFAA